MPLDPITSGALISAGGSFASGLLGADSASKDRALYRQQMKQAQAQFDAQMDQSVQRRVKDAMAAGVHPLFALGASVGASPTIDAGYAPQTGNSMGQGLEAAMMALANIPTMKAEARRNEAAAMRDEAEAMFLDSQRKRLEGEVMGGRGRDGLGIKQPEGATTWPYPQTKAVYGPAEYFAPEVPFSSRPGVRSGPIPGKIEIVREDGRSITMPNPDLNLDEIGQVEYVVKNVRLWATDRIEDIAAWIKSDAPSDRDVQRLEETLRLWKENPQQMRDAEELIRSLPAKVRHYWRKFHQWRN